MTVQGLLVRGTNGEDYLLTTEPHRGTRTHRLMVVKKIHDEWQPVDGVHALACREALIGAFVDFVVDLCRVLNSSDYQQTSEGVCIQRQAQGDRHAAEPALRPQRGN